MNAYIYQADIYCEDCGRALCRTVPFPTDADAGNEASWDSDDYPKGPYPDGGGESDSPYHCAAGDDCLNAITLRVHGKRYKVGVPLENPLTSYGVQYVRAALAEPRGLCRRLWARLYREELQG